jgi:N-hydroxyarylamine O-acetyltransferase
MTTSLDLDAYFTRIRYFGGTSPIYDTLAGLLAAHTANIPFENLDVLLNRPVRLDLGSIQDKLVRARRGGYCFEHATLFAAALEAVGFRPARHAARVVLFAPRQEASRTHMFLTVPLGGATFVVDPGFGPFTSPVPLKLEDHGAPQDDTRTHRMQRDGDLWALLVPRDGQTVTGWISTLERENPIDFELANHYIATHPASLFRNNMILSAATPDGRVNVMNRDITTHHRNHVSKTQLADRAALRALLIDHFGFDVPEVERITLPAIPEWR